MSNAKDDYSEVSRYYCGEQIPRSPKDQKRYVSSRLREWRFNENWKKQKVNINELVDKYAPGVEGMDHRVKFEWKGPEYTVSADMVAGYARVYNNKTKEFLDINGNPSSDGSKTHFKIKRKEEM